MEIKVVGDKEPVYEINLEDLGRFNEQPVLPFNAYGTLAWARAEFDNNSASSQVRRLKAVPNACLQCGPTTVLSAVLMQHARMLLVLRTTCRLSSTVDITISELHTAPKSVLLLAAQIFFLLKESELTPSGANLLDGRYAVFGYAVNGQDNLGLMKVRQQQQQCMCYEKVSETVESVLVCGACASLGT